MPSTGAAWSFFSYVVTPLPHPPCIICHGSFMCGLVGFPCCFCLLASVLGIDVKNWPPFFPILHHDIANDIPLHLQSVMRAAYWSWLGIMFCLVFNIAGVTAAWVGGAVGGASGFGNFILACIYAALGLPLSYWLWYRRLYLAMRKDGALSFAIFFIFYLIHCAFVIFASVAPPIFFKGGSLTGVWTSLEIFADGHGGVGILYALGASFFILESLLSLFVLQQVYTYFRGSGMHNRVQGEVAMGAVGGGGNWW
eukprot:TRINITY_DN2842_c0_g1_i2.p1 TRINITY_DN2842_c0_g1~~TRINITY_DN2842_c0_g1_i2.p1  ORF type:complete len:253 (+),score=30.33 TRINITY_DN2842_c0_g1_i2:82-840(+)